MFYHLSDPVTFSQDVASIMDESTIWCIQMSYAGSMMQNCVVDNIVHEHITYYTLKSLSYLASICGLEVFDAEIIEVYGGSIRAFLRKKNHLTSSTKTDNLKKIEEYEAAHSINEFSALYNFNILATTFKKNFRTFIDYLTSKNEKIYGFGASTKGNMLLQYLEITENQILGVYDNNSKKIGSSMMGTNISVIDERQLSKSDATKLISLPYYYHENFKNLIPKLMKDLNKRHLGLIRPLPTFEYHEFR